MCINCDCDMNSERKITENRVFNNYKIIVNDIVFAMAIKYNNK